MWSCCGTGVTFLNQLAPFCDQQEHVWLIGRRVLDKTISEKLLWLWWRGTDIDVCVFIRSCIFRLFDHICLIWHHSNCNVQESFATGTRVTSTSVHLQGLKEVLPLLLYPPIYFLFWVIVVATRIYNVLQKVQFQFSLTLAHYVAFLLVALLLIPLVFLLHSSINFCRKKRNKLYTPSTTTSYIVPNECSDQEDEPLIIKGQGTLVPSMEYQSVFEGSAKWWSRLHL